FTLRRIPVSDLFPYTTLFRSHLEIPLSKNDAEFKILPCSTSGLVLYRTRDGQPTNLEVVFLDTAFQQRWGGLIQVEPKYQLVNQDRKSTRLNSSHVKISYAVF